MYRQFVSAETSLKLRFEQLTEEFEEEKAICAHLNEVLQALKQDVARRSGDGKNVVASLNQLRMKVDEKMLLEAELLEMQRLERLAIVAYLQVLETVGVSMSQLRFVSEHCALSEDLRFAFLGCSRLSSDMRKGFVPKRPLSQFPERKVQPGEPRRSRLLFSTEIDIEREKAVERFLREVKPYFSLSKGELLALVLKAKPDAGCDAEEFATTAVSVPVLHWLVTPELVEEHVRTAGLEISPLLNKTYDLLRSNLISLCSSSRQVFSLLATASTSEEVSLAKATDFRGISPAMVQDLMAKRGKLTHSQKEIIREKIMHTVTQSTFDSGLKQEAAQISLQRSDKTPNGKSVPTLRSIKFEFDEELDEHVTANQHFLKSARNCAKQLLRPMTEQAIRRPERSTFFSPKQSRAQYVRNTVISIDKNLSRIQRLERKVGEERVRHRDTLSLVSPRITHSRGWSSSGLDTRASLYTRVCSRVSSSPQTPQPVKIQLLP